MIAGPKQQLLASGKLLYDRDHPNRSAYTVHDFTLSPTFLEKIRNQQTHFADKSAKKLKLKTTRYETI